MPNLQLDSNDPASAPARAFLVVRRGGRWTDLLRLTPERSAVIGRASSSQIIIRSDQVSRRHAEIRWDDGRWWVKDLSSRNGTLLDGKPIAAGEVLSEGSRIEVGGCVMTFVSTVSHAVAPVIRPRNTGKNDSPGSQPPDDQLTSDGFGPLDYPASAREEVTYQAHESRFIDPLHTPMLPTQSLADDGWQWLFQLSHRLASTESVTDAAQQTLVTLSHALAGSSGGVFLPTATEPLTLVAFVGFDDRSYRPPNQKLIESVGQSGNAMVVRNLIDDDEFQDADSRGEYSMTSTLIAPIAITSSADDPARVGFLHLYTTDAANEYTGDELDLAIAAAGTLAAAINNLRTHRQLTRSLRTSRQRVRQLRERLGDSTQMVGNGEAITKIKSLISRVAQTDSTILVRGESGVGKELVSSAIHHASPRRDGAFVCLNCAALAPTLLESELFGHEKGSFTGATEQKKGKFEAAHGGTLMLDEVGEMHVDLQAKLLRVLEGHPFERLGGQTPIKTNVRVVAATNRDLADEVRLGRFRADLFYRLNVIEVVVPPLRQRRDDILTIANHYLEYFSDKTARAIDGFTSKASDALLAHSWPGNIRELKNAIERAVVLGAGGTIDVDDLNLTVVPSTVESTPMVNDVAETEVFDEPADMQSLSDLEMAHLIHVLKACGGNKSRAAIILGIERSTLDRKLKRFAIKPSSYLD